jgi:hypothetical protein
MPSLFSTPKSPAAIPVAPTPIVQPTADTTANSAQQQQTAAAAAAQSGRMSTILTSQTNTGSSGDKSATLG